MSLCSFSVTKKVSLILGQKAYFSLVNNSMSSQMIPLPSADVVLTSAMYKKILSLKDVFLVANKSHTFLPPM